LFEEVEIHHVPDETPTPDDYHNEVFTVQEMREIKRSGALLLTASKPNLSRLAGPFD
jgi:hypothetical protein